MTKFGKEFREKYFPTGPDIVPLNHGSYGLVPVPVLDKLKAHIDEEFSFPDKYITFSYEESLDANLGRVAKLLDCDPLSLAFCTNASTAVNIVLRSFPFAKGDKVLIVSTVYGACGNTVKFIEKRLGVEVVRVQLDYPLEDDEVVAKIADAISAEAKTGKPVKIAMFDTVTSMPGVRVPFERLIQLCKENDVLSLVDGAHTIGLIDISINKLKPDFFTTNIHKWLLAPRACAVLYVDPKHHRVVHTMPVSHSYLDDEVVLSDELEKTRFRDRFAIFGSINFAPYATVADAIDFRESVCGGEQAIMDYCNKTAKEGAKLVSEYWGTPILENKTGTLSTAMINVQAPIPAEYKDAFIKLASADPAFVAKMRRTVDRILIEDFNTFLPCAFHNGALWCRFSAQVYLEAEEFLQGAKGFEVALRRYLESDEFKELSK